MHTIKLLFIEVISICGLMLNESKVYFLMFFLNVFRVFCCYVLFSCDERKFVWRFFRHCPPDYVCLRAGPNPNHGFTNFDNFLWSMLTTFQLITLDYWENVYNMVSKMYSVNPRYLILVFHLFC